MAKKISGNSIKWIYKNDGLNHVDVEITVGKTILKEDDLNKILSLYDHCKKYPSRTFDLSEGPMKVTNHY